MSTRKDSCDTTPTAATNPWVFCVGEQATLVNHEVCDSAITSMPCLKWNDRGPYDGGRKNSKQPRECGNDSQDQEGRSSRNVAEQEGGGRTVGYKKASRQYTSSHCNA